MAHGPDDGSILDGDFRVGEHIVRPVLKIVRPLSGEDTTAEQVRLPDKAMAVLLVLVANHRQVCERDDILDQVWGEDREAYDRVLDNAIREIRRAFGDDARNPSYIQTISKRGYRLIAEIEGGLVPRVRTGRTPIDTPPRGPAAELREESAELPAPSSEGPSAEVQAGSTSTGGGSSRRVLGLGAALAALAVLFWASAQTSRTYDISLDVERASQGTEATAESFRAGLTEALIDQHPCGEQNLLRASTWPWSAGEKIRISLESKASQASASIEMAGTPPFRVEADLAAGNRSAWLDHVANELGVALDQRVCKQESLDPVRRACHCVAATRQADPIIRAADTVPYLEAAVDLDPLRTEAYEVLIPAYRRSGRFELANEVLERGLLQVDDPESDSAVVLRALHAQILREHSTEHDLWRGLVDRDPASTRWRLALANFLAFEQGDCAAADEVLGAIPPVELRSTRQFSPRSQICGRHEELIEVLEPRVAASPKNLGLRHWLAVSQSRVGRFEQAIETAQTAMAIDPSAASSLFIIARIEESRGHYASADVWFERAIAATEEGTGTGSYFLTDWAMSHLYRGDPQTALDILRDVDPGLLIEDVRPLWLEGLAALATGDAARAEELLAEIERRIRPRGSRRQERFALHLAGRLLSARGEHAAAADKLEQALARAPSERQLLLRDLAEIHHRAGAPALESAAYGRILAINPRDPWALCGMAALADLQGDRQGAIVRARLALEVFGDPPEDPIGVECAERLGQDPPIPM